MLLRTSLVTTFFPSYLRQTQGQLQQVYGITSSIDLSIPLLCCDDCGALEVLGLKVLKTTVILD